MLNVRVDMGKLHCGMQTQQWNNDIVTDLDAVYGSDDGLERKFT